LQIRFAMRWPVDWKVRAGWRSYGRPRKSWTWGASCKVAMKSLNWRPESARVKGGWAKHIPLLLRASCRSKPLSACWIDYE
jgi:hypothetical protein